MCIHLDMRMAIHRHSRAMSENEIARIVVNLAYRIHTQMGPGLLDLVNGLED